MWRRSAATTLQAEFVFEHAAEGRRLFGVSYFGCVWLGWLCVDRPPPMCAHCRTYAWCTSLSATNPPCALNHRLARLGVIRLPSAVIALSWHRVSGECGGLGTLHAYMDVGETRNVYFCAFARTDAHTLDCDTSIETLMIYVERCSEGKPTTIGCRVGVGVR